MCLPALAIAALATGIGGALSYAGQQKADHAMTRTFTRERERQKGFEADEIAKFQDSLNQAGNMADPNAQDAATAAREHVLSGVTKTADPAASGYLPSAGSAPTIVANAGAQAGAAANARTSQLAHALAALGGTQDVLQKTNIGIGRNSQEIGQIGGFKRGSLDVLQSEMDAAKQKGSTLRMLGGLAQSVGQMMLAGGGGPAIPKPDMVTPWAVTAPGGVAPSLPGGFI